MNLLIHSRRSLANLFATLLVLVLTASNASGQSPAPAPANILSTKDEVQASMNKVPCEKSARLDGVKQLFTSVGAAETDLSIEKFDKDKISNLVVRKKGETDETIVIGAHYDRTDDGCGATDNWSGITILAHLYKTILPLKTKKSYIFVAFDQEEKGLLGSRQMLKAMGKPDIAQICSMVNFDSFGQAYPMALKNASSSKMLKLAETLGKESGFTFQSVEIQGASSDSAAFIEKKVPAITLSGLGSNWTEILHTKNDKLDKVNIDSVYLGYRFDTLYVSKLDAGACGDFK